MTAQAGDGRVFVLSIGARMHYAVPRILEEAGRLDRLVTGLVATKMPLKFLAQGLRRGGRGALRRGIGRVPRGVPAERIIQYAGLDAIQLGALALARNHAKRTEINLEFSRRFCRRAATENLRHATAVYAYDTAALELLEAARSQGRTAVVEQTVAPRCVVNRLARREWERFPEWEREPATYPDSVMEREFLEWRTADRVICGSDFVRNGIAEAGGDTDRCLVVPYGVDLPCEREPERQRQREASAAPSCRRSLRVLVVGSLSLRKGTPYVVEAAERLTGKCEFRLIGPSVLKERALERTKRATDYRGQVPRQDMRQHFAWADVFLLPSVCEGSATVTYEALSNGVPVICTESAGSVVVNGLDGLLIPEGSTSAVVRGLTALLENAAQLESLTTGAVSSGERVSVEAYARRLLAAL